MIEVENYFSHNEMLFINALNQSLSSKYDLNGRVIDNGGFVRYEVSIGAKEDDAELILQFCLRDEEDADEGFCNFVHISNILVPRQYKGQLIATIIITIMSFVANKQIGIGFYITGIVNDRWKESLIQMGGIEDESGDVEIVYDIWIQYLEYKLNNLGYLQQVKQ
ncbi:MAG: hypothetical protein VB095_00750 [Anaerovorax sp.]|nr:hypothetical protein [Anaerovorax sp.]